MGALIGLAFMVGVVVSILVLFQQAGQAKAKIQELEEKVGRLENRLYTVRG